MFSTITMADTTGTNKTGFLKREPASNCMDTYIYKEKLGMLSVLTNISG
jgi:hypothetical protein